MRDIPRIQRQDHPSYDSHRREVWTRVLLPVIVAALLLIALIFFTARAALNGTGDVTRWAAISTIWLVIPVMLFGLIIFVVFGALVYLVARLTGLIPPYSYQAQRFAYRVEAASRRGADMVRRPILALREAGAFVRSRLARARERM